MSEEKEKDNSNLLLYYFKKVFKYNKNHDLELRHEINYDLIVFLYIGFFNQAYSNTVNDIKQAIVAKLPKGKLKEIPNPCFLNYRNMKTKKHIITFLKLLYPEEGQLTTNRGQDYLSKYLSLI